MATLLTHVSSRGSSDYAPNHQGRGRSVSCITRRQCSAENGRSEEDPKGEPSLLATRQKDDDGGEMQQHLCLAGEKSWNSLLVTR
jgi:hypothetical protein